MLRFTRFLELTLPFALAAACGGNTPAAGPAVPNPESRSSAATSAAQTTAVPVPAPTVSVTSTVAVAPPPPPASTPVLVWRDMATPESVLYDEATDRYLVSNINGKPLEADNNGFISELSPDGKVLKQKWIEGAAKLKLNAPKGMGLAKGTLYVADIDRLRMFDAKTGAAKGEVVIAGAAFLNDVAVSRDGSQVFVSDSGLKQGATDLEPNGADAVYVVEKGQARALAKGPQLNRPNGLLWTERGVLVNTFGAAELYRLDDKGAKLDITPMPMAGLDGLAAAGDVLLASSWPGKAVYAGKLGGTFTPVLHGLNAPADIAYDSKRKRVLVPRFLDNTVEAYDLPSTQAVTTKY
jgi:DNA-binding beta-propeller fold protein YncE